MVSSFESFSDQAPLNWLLSLADCLVSMVLATDSVAENVASGNIMVCVNSGAAGNLQTQLTVTLESTNIKAR